jgi:EAL domain-containing protein (putative c-di-GMP-specific phosphodiesterase class I)
MHDDHRDRVLVDLIVRIGTVLDVDVVAEGVETDEQLATLRDLGCRLAQGYLLGRPMPGVDLERTFAPQPGVAIGAQRR